MVRDGPWWSVMGHDGPRWFHDGSTMEHNNNDDDDYPQAMSISGTFHAQGHILIFHLIHAHPYILVHDTCISGPIRQIDCLHVWVYSAVICQLLFCSLFWSVCLCKFEKFNILSFKEGAFISPSRNSPFWDVDTQLMIEENVSPLWCPQWPSPLHPSHSCLSGT